MKLMLWLAALLPLVALGQPLPAQQLSTTLESRGSAYYRFEHFELPAADGQRRYRVRLAIPRRQTPAAGYPALYLLDGNAALMALREDWRAELQQGQPPLLVMVGPASDLRLDLPGRVFDYTPEPVAGVGAPDPALNGLATGGGAAFRQLLTEQVRPEVARRVAMDASQQGIWGHSLGGLFVLDTLRCCSDSYSLFIAASPSLWWQSGLLLQRFERFAPGSRVNLLVLQGGAERKPAGAPLSARGQAMAAVPASAARELSQRLAQANGLTARYHEFPGLDHGQMLAVSLRSALRVSAGLEPVNDEE
jgi:predicted alpha/beta superfamily hydrolase